MEESIQTFDAAARIIATTTEKLVLATSRVYTAAMAKEKQQQQEQQLQLSSSSAAAASSSSSSSSSEASNYHLRIRWDELVTSYGSASRQLDSLWDVIKSNDAFGMNLVIPKKMPQHMNPQTCKRCYNLNPNSKNH